MKNQNNELEHKRLNESIRTLHRKVNLLDDRLKRHIRKGKMEKKKE